MKIALLTPYTGSNLGDAAIQEAVIKNIRRRYPDAVIWMITLRPELTTVLHGVPSFPITPFAISYYARGSSSNKFNNINKSLLGSNNNGLLDCIKRTIKATQWLHSLLKSIQQILTSLWNVTKLIYEEFIYVVRAYRLLKDFDLLIVSGGGQLDDYWGGPWGHPYALLRWGIIAKTTGSKYIFLSVGTCALESPLSRFFVRRALRLADYRSYRDKTSKTLLEYLDFTRGDLVYPDLAFSYIGRAKSQMKSTQVDKRVVGISPIAYLSRHGWPKKNIRVYENYFNTLVKFILILIQRNYSIVLLSTDASDQNVVSDIVDTLKENHKLDVTGLVSQPDTRTPEELFDQLSKVNYVVASRLHGIILSNFCCLPVLAISYDRKVDTYMSDVGFPDCCLDIHCIEINSLLKNFESLATNSELITSRLIENKNSYASDLERQYDLVLKKGL